MRFYCIGWCYINGIERVAFGVRFEAVIRFSNRFRTAKAENSTFRRFILSLLNCRNKMQPLNINSELLKLFNLRAHTIDDDDTSWTVRQRNQIYLFIIFVFLCYGLSASLYFIYEFIETDLESALFAVFQVAAEFSTLHTVFITSIFPYSVRNFFNKLKDVRGNGKFRLSEQRFFQNDE